MFARCFCYFAALMLAGPAPAATIGHLRNVNEIDLRSRLLRAQSIMQELEQRPAAEKIDEDQNKLALWWNVGPVGRSPWNNAWTNAAAPWSNGWGNAPVHVNPFNNWTNWNNAAAQNWNNARAWANATPKGIPGEVCSQGLGCSTPPAQGAQQSPAYNEGQTYFPHGSTFDVGE
jgi:hypothetical protein